MSKFKSYHPGWEFEYDVGGMLEWIHTKNTKNVLEFSLWYLTRKWSA